MTTEDSLLPFVFIFTPEQDSLGWWMTVTHSQMEHLSGMSCPFSLRFSLAFSSLTAVLQLRLGLPAGDVFWKGAPVHRKESWNRKGLGCWLFYALWSHGQCIRSFAVIALRHGCSQWNPTKFWMTGKALWTLIILETLGLPSVSGQYCSSFVGILVLSQKVWNGLS